MIAQPWYGFLVSVKHEALILLYELVARLKLYRAELLDRARNLLFCVTRLVLTGCRSGSKLALKLSNAI